MNLRCESALMALSARNFAQLVAFYQQLLQQESAIFLPNSYAEFQLPDLRLGIFKHKENGRTRGHGDTETRGQLTVNGSLLTVNCPPSTYGFSLCLEVENLEAAIAHLTQLGYPPPGEIITASHGREIYAYDPEGNWLILHQSH
jgi:hypothetical protein